MDIVASLFVRDGLIDYKEFVNALKDKPVSVNSLVFSSCLDVELTRNNVKCIPPTR